MSRIIRKIGHYHSALGFAGALAFVTAKLLGKKPVFKKNLPGYRHPVYVRIGTTDTSVLKQVLLERHYDLPLPTAPKVIVDAGANIGLAAVFFANKYPDAMIVALEPEASNFEMLKKNVAAYPQVRALKAALWKENREICLIDSKQGHHGFQTMEQEGKQDAGMGMVPAMTMEALMEKMGLSGINLLKIDIEGAEKEVFENSSGWLDKVDVIMAELHDNLKAGCEQAFADATKGFPGEATKGETVMRLRQPQVAQAV